MNIFADIFCHLLKIAFAIFIAAPAIIFFVLTSAKSRQNKKE